MVHVLYEEECVFLVGEFVGGLIMLDVVAADPFQWPASCCKFGVLARYGGREAEDGKRTRELGVDVGVREANWLLTMIDLGTKHG
jgi:hypothetical protein